MDVEACVLIRADFYRISNIDSIESVLSKQFEYKQVLNKQVFSVKDWELRCGADMYGPHRSIDSNHFEEVYAFLVKSSDVEDISQILTVGLLNNDTIEELDKQTAVEARSTRTEIREELEQITSKYPGGLTTDESPYPGIFMVHTDADVVSSVDATEAFRTSIADLDAYGIDPYESLTVVDDRVVIANDWESRRESPLTTISQVDDTLYPLNSADDWASWFRLTFRQLKLLIQPLLVDHWLRSRSAAIRSVDNDSHGFTIPETDETKEPADVRDTEEDLESLRDDWVQEYTTTTDDLSQMKQLLENYVQGESPPPIETPIPPNGKGYLTCWTSHLESRISDLEYALERIQTKLDMIARIIQDRLQSTATRSNLSLQTSVERLTWLLLGLGILQFVVSIRDTDLAGMVIEYMNPVLAFVPMTELIVLLSGFLFIGYVVGRLE